MLLSLLVPALLVACHGDEPPPPGDDDDTSPTGATGETGTTPSTCEGLAITDLSSVQGTLGNQRRVTVTTSAAAPVAVRCVADDDPAELHLLESPEGTTHTLTFSGLLPSTAFTCAAVAACGDGGSAPATTTFTTGPAPTELPAATVVRDAGLGMTGAFTLAIWQAGGGCGAGNGVWLVAWDPEGRVRWWRPMDPSITIGLEALWHDDIDSVVWGGGGSAEGRVHIQSMADGDTYAAENLPGATTTVFHHDAKRLADGRLLTIEDRDNTDGGRTWLGFGIRAHDPATGAVSLDLDSQRWVDDGVLPPSTGYADRDPYHANWMDLVTIGGEERLYVSLCFDRSILRVDPATGEVVWKLQANDGWTVVDGAGAPLGQGDLPQCQHGLEVLGDDRLLVYDNGQLRRESRAAIFAIDAATRTVTREWVWTDGWFEDTLGDIDDLAPGRVLVTQAHPECWSRSPGARSRVVEVDTATGRVASEVLLGVRDALYRAERYDGCAFLRGTRFCPATLARAAELAPLFGG